MTAVVLFCFGASHGCVYLYTKHLVQTGSNNHGNIQFNRDINMCPISWKRLSRIKICRSACEYDTVWRPKNNVCLSFTTLLGSNFGRKVCTVQKYTHLMFVIYKSLSLFLPLLFLWECLCFKYTGGIYCYYATTNWKLVKTRMQRYIGLRVRTVAKRHMRSPMFTASFILVSCFKLP